MSDTKRREWWVWYDWIKCLHASEIKVDGGIRVIEAPSEAEIEAAVEAGMDMLETHFQTTDELDPSAIRAAIRKLLGGGE